MKSQRRILAGATVVVAWVAASQEVPPTITASDMFNVSGQYYRAYANAPQTAVDVSNWLGVPSDQEQFWDFSAGPQEVTYRFDYFAAQEVPHNEEFPQAALAEQKADEAGVLDPAWLFFSQDPSRGRVVEGFFDPSLGAVSVLGISFMLVPPAGIFQPPLRDFPATITFGTEWAATTTYTNLLTLDDGGGDDEGLGGAFDFPQQTTYTSNSKVDAWGVINLPTMGLVKCLRINELVQYDLAVDMGSGWEQFGTAYLRNYYWLGPGRGIVAQVTSEQQQTGPPPDQFPIAAAVLRMFDTNHPAAEPPPPPTIRLTILLNQQNPGAVLSWDVMAGVSSYRVEHTTTPADRSSWVLLGTRIPTTQPRLSLYDPAANSPDLPARYYRVVGVQ